MNETKFQEIMKNQLEVETDIINSKGKDYIRGNPDRLHNFKSIAERTGLSPYQVWQVYFLKHLDAIDSYMKLGTESEPIYLRIADARNYLLLLLAMIEENNTIHEFVTEPVRSAKSALAEGLML